MHGDVWKIDVSSFDSIPIYRIMLGMHNNEKIERKIKFWRNIKEIIIVIISEILMRSKLLSLMETTKTKKGVGSSKTLTKKKKKTN